MSKYNESVNMLPMTSTVTQVERGEWGAYKQGLS